MTRLYHISGVLCLLLLLFSCHPKTAQDFLADGKLDQDEAAQLVMNYPEAKECMSAKAMQNMVRGGWTTEITSDDKSYHVVVTGDLYDPKQSASHPFICGEWDVDKKTGTIQTRYIDH